MRRGDPILAAPRRLLAAGVIALSLACGAKAPVFPESAQIPAHVLLPAGAPGVRDDRARFREIFCAVLESERPDEVTEPCATYLHQLLDEAPSEALPSPPPSAAEDVQLLFVPGLFNGCLGGSFLAYNRAFPALRERGYSIQHIPVSSFGSTRFNAELIAEAWPGLVRDPDRKLILAGYSKGAPDILEFLIRYPELAAEVDAVVSISGAINGSPLADEMSELMMKLVQWGAPGCERGDEQAIQSLQRPLRMSWLANHPLPGHIRFFSLGVFTDRAHVSIGLLGGYEAAARIDPRNDGQLLAYDQIIPGSMLLGFANADHWGVAVPDDEDMPTVGPLFADDSGFPRTVLIESILLYLREALAAPE